MLFEDFLKRGYPHRHLRHLNEEYETPRYRRNRRRIDEEFDDCPPKYSEEDLARDDTKGLSPDYTEIYAGISSRKTGDSGILFKIVHYLNNKPIFVSPSVPTNVLPISIFKTNILSKLKNKKIDFNKNDLQRHLNYEMKNPQVVIKTDEYSEDVLKKFLDFFYTKFLTGRYRRELKESKFKMSEKDMLKLSRKIAKMFDLDVN